MNPESLYAVEYHSLSPTQLGSLLGEDCGMQIQSQDRLLTMCDKLETVGDTVIFIPIPWLFLPHPVPYTCITLKFP